MKVEKDKIEDILRHYDPMGLISLGAPCDEYNQEAEIVAEQLMNWNNKDISAFLIQKLVYQVFAEQFGGEDIAGNFDGYKDLAVEIYKEIMIYG